MDLLLYMIARRLTATPGRSYIFVADLFLLLSRTLGDGWNRGRAPNLSISICLRRPAG